MTSQDNEAASQAALHIFSQTLTGTRRHNRGWLCVRITPQDDEAATKADKISTAEAALCFQRDTAHTIHNKVRV